MDAPRPKFWSYAELKNAKTHFEIKDNKLELKIEHPFLTNVTPKMLSWWYKNLATGIASVKGVHYTYYHLFHLSEHGLVKILSPASDGSFTMGKGAVVYRREWFGSHRSIGKAYVESFDENGFVMRPFVGPFVLGRIEHKFKAINSGTLYTVDISLGSDAPVFGKFINIYIQKVLFSPEVLQEWMRHQVEEVSSTIHYLPQLYNNEPIVVHD